MTDTNKPPKETISNKELESAVKTVQAAIRAMEAEYRKIGSMDDQSPIMLEGETSTGYYCQMMVDPKDVAEVFLKYDYPVWRTLEEDVPQEMWDELARIYGLETVSSVDL